MAGADYGYITIDGKEYSFPSSSVGIAYVPLTEVFSLPTKEGYVRVGFYNIDQDKKFPASLACQEAYDNGLCSIFPAELGEDTPKTESIWLPETCTINTQTLVDIGNKIRGTFYEILSTTLLAPNQFAQYIVDKISFTIGGTTYHAIDGMTWAEWIDTPFNTGGFGISSNNIVINSNRNLLLYMGSYVSISELIYSGKTYEISAAIAPILPT